MLPKAFIEEMKSRLLEEKKKLEQDLSGLHSHQELGEDLDSNVQEVEDDEVAQDVIFRMKADLEKVNKALAKIADGSFGIGDDGQPIPENRLRAMPWADRAI